MTSQPTADLVPAGVLDRAMDVVRQTCKELGVRADVAAEHWDWKDDPGLSPLVWITAWVREERQPGDLLELGDRIGDELRKARLTEPDVPIGAGPRPGW